MSETDLPGFKPVSQEMRLRIFREVEALAVAAITAQTRVASDNPLHAFYGGIVQDTVLIAQNLQRFHGGIPLDPRERDDWSLSSRDELLSVGLADVDVHGPGLLIADVEDDVLLPKSGGRKKFDEHFFLAQAASDLAPYRNIRVTLEERAAGIPDDSHARKAFEIQTLSTGSLSVPPSQRLGRIRRGQGRPGDEKVSIGAERRIRGHELQVEAQNALLPSTMVARVMGLVSDLQANGLGKLTRNIGSMLMSYRDWMPMEAVMEQTGVLGAMRGMPQDHELFGRGAVNLLLNPDFAKLVAYGEDSWPLYRALHRVAMAAGIASADAAYEINPGGWAPVYQRKQGKMVSGHPTYLTPLATAPPADVLRQRYAELIGPGKRNYRQVVAGAAPAILRQPLTPAPPRATPAQIAVAPEQKRSVAKRAGLPTVIDTTHMQLERLRADDAREVTSGIERVWSLQIPPNTSENPFDEFTRFLSRTVAGYAIRDPRTRRLIGIAGSFPNRQEPSQRDVHVYVFPEHGGFGAEAEAADALAVESAKIPGIAKIRVVVENDWGRRHPNEVNASSLLETTPTPAKTID